MSSTDDLTGKLRKVAAEMVESGELGRLAMELVNSGELAREVEGLDVEEGEDVPLGSTEATALVPDRYWQKRCEHVAKLEAEQSELDTQRRQIKAQRATLRKSYEGQKALLLAELLEPITSLKLAVEDRIRGIGAQIHEVDEKCERLRVELAKVDAASWWRRTVAAGALDAQRQTILLEQRALVSHRGVLELSGLPLQQELTGIEDQLAGLKAQRTPRDERSRLIKIRQSELKKEYELAKAESDAALTGLDAGLTLVDEKLEVFHHRSRSNNNEIYSAFLRGFSSTGGRIDWTDVGGRTDAMNIAAANGKKISKTLRQDCASLVQTKGSSGEVEESSQTPITELRDAFLRGFSSISEHVDWSDTPAHSRLLEDVAIYGQQVSRDLVTKCYSAATLRGYRLLKEYGEKIVMRWSTSLDDRVCAICEALDNKTEKHWIKKYPDGPPVHPGCRCGIGYEQAGAGSV